ncbi:dihydroorotase [Methanoregula sp.]|jgi:dihydroorotase|uniref:dihydroorotase n=1 Tax=Methanoregula sp. TaxID=2052170 RepID=UPI00260CACE5|nr:dihydroorotase [Methanoregula sp.]MDD5142097.1 dihydroorotase [Methanoregula sp.]
MTAPALVLRNVLLLGGRTADITVQEGKVLHTGAGASGKADRTIDCNGLYVLPAAVDMHVHMRGGPQSAKEDWATGSRSALAGGVTVVLDQPNTIPPIITPGVLGARILEGKTHSLCNFAINSGVTHDTPIRSMWRAGAMAFGETFFAPSSYGKAITPGELEPALGEISACGALATIHAEEVGQGDDSDLASHDRIRSAAGELRAVGEVGRCNTTGCRLHFCHMSTRDSVLAASALGSVEVTPHHLFLSREDFVEAETLGKVNPPLRSEDERKKLWEAWDKITVVASDHAPHTPAEKQAVFKDAPAGIPGVETMLPLLMAAVLEKRISLSDVIRKTSHAPAELLGIRCAGFNPGDRADFTLYPKNAVSIDPDSLHSKCGFSPYSGLPAIFPRMVILGGEVVYDMGEFTRGSPQWFAGKGYCP